MIRSKFSINAWFFSLLPLGFVVLGLVFLTHPQWQFKNKLGGSNSALVPGVILVVGMGAFLFFLLRNMTVLSIDRGKLDLYSFRGKRTIDHNEIQTIDLWGRARVNGAPSELIHIELKNGEKVNLNGWSYRNLPELKRALEAGYPELLTPAPQSQVKPTTSTEPQVFSGPLLPSFKGILFFGFLIAAIVLAFTIKIWTALGIIISLVFPAIPLTIMGVQLYYFRLTADELEICNHVAPWYRKRYPLNSIANITLERSSRNWSNIMRIRTYDHCSDGYPAGTLRHKHWKALAGALRRRGIHVNTQGLGI